MITSLYVHIPFCNNICSYCDFPKVFSNSFNQKEYIDVLLYELETLNIKNKLKTIYIGGGTPSALKVEELERLLKTLSKLLDTNYEFTLEANPESLDLDKIKVLKKYKVNRVSLGVQSTSLSKKKILERKHSNLEVINVVKNLKDNGIENINLDFIYGTRNDSINKIRKDIKLIKKLNVPHASFYSLQIESGTKLYNQKQVTCSEEKLEKLYFYINSKLKKLGFNHYEVSNWAKENYYSKHNLVYWNDLEDYALGLGASSYIENKRYTNTKSMNSYMKKEFNRSVEELDLLDQEFEFIMLGLRKSEGINLKEFKSRFNKDFIDAYKNKIEKLKSYLNINLEYVAVKEEYIYTLNLILVELLNFK